MLACIQPAGDHGMQLRKFRRCKEDGRSGESQLEVGCSRLAKHVRGGDKVEQVVDELEGDPEVFPVEESFVSFCRTRLG